MSRAEIAKRFAHETKKRLLNRIRNIVPYALNKRKTEYVMENYWLCVNIPKHTTISLDGTRLIT